jgi:hypothetical protein
MRDTHFDSRKLALHIMLVIVLMAVGCESSETSSTPSLNSTVSDLDQRSRDGLGVSIASLGLLFEARPGVYFLAESLKAEGRDKMLRELERGGYLSIRSRQSPQGELIELELSERGKALHAALNDQY